jgi:hypothetical protein
MPEKKPLRISTAFGPSRDQAVVLAVHPDEEHAPGGKPRPDRRTFVLRLEGNRAVLVETRPLPLVRSWYSTGSGVGYCSSVASDKLYKWQAGRWSEEVFHDKPVQFVRFVFGFPGPTPDADLLFLAAREGVFVRDARGWRLLKQAAGFPLQVHGRASTEVFVGGETLFRWDGKKLSAMESPEDDTIAVLQVTADDRLVGGDTYMSITTPAGTWERLPMPMKEFRTMTELGGVIYAGTLDGGVARVLPGPGVAVTTPFNVALLANLGDALLASGDGQTFVGDGTRWEPIQVPAYEAGQRA